MSKSRYARLHGSFWRHDRTAGLPLAAKGLHACAMAFCADNMTDGRVRKEMVLVFAGGVRPVKEIGALIHAGVWIENGEHYELRDWAQHNITRDSWEKKKEEKRAWMKANRPPRGPKVDDHAAPTETPLVGKSFDLSDEDEGRGRRTKDEEILRSDQVDQIRSPGVRSDPERPARVDPETPVGLPAVPETHTPSSLDPAQEHPARQLRRVFDAHHEKKRGTLVLFENYPKRMQTSVRVSAWLLETCKRARVQYDDGAARLVSNYFASEKGERFRHGWDFFASCPEEFWNAEAGDTEQDRIRIQCEIDQKTEERRAAYERLDDERARALGEQIAQLNASLPRAAPDLGRARGSGAARR